MNREEMKAYANRVIDLGLNDETQDFCKSVISALSAEGKYIKKEETAEYVDSYIQELNTGYGDVNSHTNRILRMISDGIRNMPTYSFPDREKGEWIKIQSGDDKFPESIVCSKCKNENSHLDFDEHGEPIGKVFITSKFCPNCGADMRGDKE